LLKGGPAVAALHKPASVTHRWIETKTIAYVCNKDKEG